MSFPLSNDESSRVPGTAGCQFAGGLPDSGYLVPLAPDYLSGYRFAADGRHVAMYHVPDYRYLTIPGTRLSVLSINPWPLCTRYRYPVIHYVPDTAMYQVPLSVISLLEPCTWYHSQSSYFNPSISENFANASGMSIS